MADMITKNIGKNTIGDNNKMSVSMRKYQRSTHDLSYAWRNTQTVGTLVPFMCEVGLPGDTWELNTAASVLTHPTVGPLFGSFKLQGEYYVCPIRLYNGLLHNNALGIGLKMSQVKLPKISISLNQTDNPTAENEYSQINPSCLLSYLGLKGYGSLIGKAATQVKKNITSTLAYWDIFKNYHANKQETKAYYIGANAYVKAASQTGNNSWSTTGINIYKNLENGATLDITFNTTVNTENVKFKISQNGKVNTYNIEEVLQDYTENGSGLINGTVSFNTDNPAELQVVTYNKINLTKFALENLDTIREDILKSTGANNEYLIQSSYQYEPIKGLTQRLDNNTGKMTTTSPMFGLAIKTYQSDIFNNWINTEWLDGEGGINEITAIDVSSGSFTMDTLNLAKKVYDMLNRIAVSGGTYQDWIQTVYTNDYIERSETPIYEGGFSSEIIFQEVISNSATENEPLGTLAGRGQNTGLKGGTVKIKIDEPSYIIGLVSITPRIDYMTNYNKVFGNFAIKDNEMFMTLNRKYEIKNEYVNQTITAIGDLTTYIDPEKYNYIFADTSLDAMNFWVQLGIGAKVRRKMSAKVIPNL